MLVERNIYGSKLKWGKKMIEIMELEIHFDGDEETIIDILESLRMVTKVKRIN